LAAVVCGAIVIAPLGPFPLLYWAFASVCHQQPERALWLAGAPVAVCARCAGVYFGALAGLLLRFPSRRTLLLGSLGLLAMDWVTEAAGLRPAWTVARWVTGCCAGLACAGVVREAWRETWPTRKNANAA
jgi:uncharacterized membrane protein